MNCFRLLSNCATRLNGNVRHFCFVEYARAQIIIIASSWHFVQLYNLIVNRTSCEKVSIWQCELISNLKPIQRTTQLSLAWKLNRLCVCSRHLAGTHVHCNSAILTCTSNRFFARAYLSWMNGIFGWWILSSFFECAAQISELRKFLSCEI